MPCWRMLSLRVLECYADRRLSVGTAEMGVPDGLSKENGERLWRAYLQKTTWTELFNHNRIS